MEIFIWRATKNCIATGHSFKRTGYLENSNRDAYSIDIMCFNDGSKKSESERIHFRRDKRKKWRRRSCPENRSVYMLICDINACMSNAGGSFDLVAVGSGGGGVLCKIIIKYLSFRLCPFGAPRATNTHVTVENVLTPPPQTRKTRPRAYPILFFIFFQHSTRFRLVCFFRSTTAVWTTQ